MNADEERKKIFEKTDGRCHICRKQLAFHNYGKLNGKGIWEIEHSNPRANGGSDRLVNKYPACVSCNRSKGSGSTRKARAKHDYKRAPYSRKKKTEHAIIGGAIGSFLSSAIAPSPIGIAIMLGAAVGAIIGYTTEPD